MKRLFSVRVGKRLLNFKHVEGRTPPFPLDLHKTVANGDGVLHFNTKGEAKRVRNLLNRAKSSAPNAHVVLGPDHRRY